MKLDKIVVASRNKHKIEEIKAIFRDVEIISIDQLGFSDEIEETGNSFKENAKIKAETVCAALKTPVLADDSGLCVDALDGAPGIFSARFSGGGDGDNRALLLKKLDGVTNRAARFECAVCLCLPDGSTYFGEGATYGRILFAEEGNCGFGYDPLFFSDDLKKSFGSASEQEKNSVSHRYRALCDLRNKL